MSDERDPSKPQEHRRDRRAAHARIAPFEELRQRRRLEDQPVARALATAAVLLPDVKPPSVEGIEVKLNDPAPPSQDDLVERLHQVCRKAGRWREHALGAALALGDEVEVDLFGYAEGKLLPGSIKAHLRLELRPFVQLPGLVEGVLKVPVGGGDIIEVALPSDYPIAQWAGLGARFVVDVRSAWEVTAINPEVDAERKKLKRGDSLDDVMRSIWEELDGERGDALLIEAQDRVLDVVAERVDITLPKSLVDEEIRRSWGQIEARVVAHKGFSVQEQDEALHAWLDDPPMRADAERRLRVSLGLAALIDAHGITPSSEDVGALMGDIARAAGLRTSEVRDALRGEKAHAKELTETAFHLAAVAYVMERARVIVG